MGNRGMTLKGICLTSEFTPLEKGVEYFLFPLGSAHVSVLREDHMEFKPSENMSYEGLWMALDDIKRRIGDAVLSGDRINSPYIKGQRKKAETIKDELLRRFDQQAKQAE